MNFSYFFHLCKNLLTHSEDIFDYLSFFNSSHLSFEIRILSTAGNNNLFLFQNIVGSYEAQREGGILPLPAEGVEYCIVGCFFALCWDKMNVIENQDR